MVLRSFTSNTNWIWATKVGHICITASACVVTSQIGCASYLSLTHWDIFLWTRILTIVMKRRNKTALRQTMITSNMSWQWRPYGKHSLRNQMIKVISSPSMLISNFISRFNCVAIIFPIFSFYTFSQFYIWQYYCSPPISSYLIVLWLFSLFSHSILFLQILHDKTVVHHQFQII